MRFLGQAGAFRHDLGSACDRIGQVEIGNGGREGAPSEIGRCCIGKLCQNRLIGNDLFFPGKVRMGRVKVGAQRIEGVVWQGPAQHRGQCAEDGPVLARIAGRESSPLPNLHAPFEVDVGA